MGVIRPTPECGRKLVEGAVEYAANFGLSPHADFLPARLIFGDIDAARCTATYEYGRDGKPCFIAGPYDGPQRCRQIVNSLHSRLGADGYHYTLPVDAGMIADDEGEFLEVIEAETADEPGGYAGASAQSSIFSLISSELPFSSGAYIA